MTPCELLSDRAEGPTTRADRQKRDNRPDLRTHVGLPDKS